MSTKVRDVLDMGITSLRSVRAICLKLAEPAASGEPEAGSCPATLHEEAPKKGGNLADHGCRPAARNESDVMWRVRSNLSFSEPPGFASK
jgi:hypothetical protein